MMTPPHLAGLKKALIVFRVLEVCCGIVICILAALAAVGSQLLQVTYASQLTPGNVTVLMIALIVSAVMSGLGGASAIHAAICITLDVKRGRRDFTGCCAGLYGWDITFDVFYMCVWGAFLALNVLGLDLVGIILSGSQCLFFLITLAMSSAMCSKLKAASAVKQVEVSPV